MLRRQIIKCRPTIWRNRETGGSRMISIKEIRDFKTDQVKRHNARLRLQKEAQMYFDDAFEMPFVKKKHQLRTGFVAEMANGLTQRVISSTPKIYVTPRSNSNEVEKAADRVASLFNRWSKKLASQSVNPFKQAFKLTAFTRGEAWLYIPHKTEGDEDTIPVHFIPYDPMVVFADPSEFIDGQPKRVLVTYKRRVGDLRSNYPFFKYNGEDSELVDFLLYADDETMYAEAGGESNPQALFKDVDGNLVNEGRKANIYGE